MKSTRREQVVQVQIYREYDEDRSASARTGPSRSFMERVEQTHALRALAQGQTVYAVQYADGVIKIGCTGDLAHRLRRLRPEDANVVGFMPGDFEDEAAIHRTLKPFRSRGREYYRPTREVVEVVNEMRDWFGLPPLVA